MDSKTKSRTESRLIEDIDFVLSLNADLLDDFQGGNPETWRKIDALLDERNRVSRHQQERNS